MHYLQRGIGLSRLAGLLTIVGFAAVRFWDPALLETLRDRTFDLYQVAKPRPVDAYPVAIVDIDERSLAELGQWPWPRALVARLVDKLTEAGAAAVGFDLVFAEPDRLSPHRLAAGLERVDPGVRAELDRLPDNDKVLADAIRRGRTVLGQAGSPKVAGGVSAGARLPRTSVATIGGDPRGDLFRFPRLLHNLPALEMAASGRGLFTVLPGRDGIIRRVPAVLAAEDIVVPSLAIELLRVASGATSIVVKRDEAGTRSVVVAGVEIPTDRDGQLWLHFAPHDPRRYVSAADVLAGTVGAGRVAGKIAIIGTSAVGLFDLRSTPVDRVMPGVEIHAQVVESILDGRLLNRPNYALGAEVCLAVAVGVAIVIAVPMLGALPTLILGSLVALLLGAGSWYLFVTQGTLIDVAYPLASSFVVFLLLTFVNYVREERRRAQIRSAFSQYLSPDLVEQLTREPDRLVLGGETRTMSVLFSDVRGFTAIAEGYKSNPSGLTALMNRLLTPISYAIIERRGTIDKYIGDAVMAFWNAPLDDPEHALHACEAALEILRRVDALNAERRKEAEQRGEAVADMHIGIGISTGASVVGNMGSDIRFDYSVLGDSVNLASRLEGLTASYGLRVLLCSESVRHCAGMATVEIDTVRVKGKRETETVHTLLGGPELARQDTFKAFRGNFQEMRTRFVRGDWAEARMFLARARRACDLPQMQSVLEIYEGRLSKLEVGAGGLQSDVGHAVHLVKAP